MVSAVLSPCVALLQRLNSEPVGSPAANQGIRLILECEPFGRVTLLVCTLHGLFGMALVMPLIVGISFGCGRNQVEPWNLGAVRLHNRTACCLKHSAVTVLSPKTTPVSLITPPLILRKIGGGYIFIHRYLLEYFAAQSSRCS
jgi:hypothetical protein